jgi:hypothetical protein
MPSIAHLAIMRPQRLSAGTASFESGLNSEKRLFSAVCGAQVGQRPTMVAALTVARRRGRDERDIAAGPVASSPSGVGAPAVRGR